MRRRRPSAIKIVFAGILIGLVAGCAGSTVRLNPDRYAPLFSASEYGEYKGQKIYLSRIAPPAGDRKISAYRSVSGLDAYESAPASLDDYFHLCFKKAFEHAGMEVWEIAAPAGVPMLQIVFDAVSDRQFSFEVILKKEGERLFQKVLIIKETPPSSKDPLQLERNAYQMIDRSVTALLGDSGFRKAFLK